MDLYPDSQDFFDGLRYAKKHDVEEFYVHVYMESYKETGDSKYSKYNAMRIACSQNDTNIINMEII
jgi:hypothetical protein